MTEKMVFRIADVELNEILDQSKALQDQWCAVSFVDIGSIPCDHFRPEFETFAQAMKGIYCAEIICDENPTITSKCQVIAVPTTVIFRGGKEVGRYEGPYSHEALKERVQNLMTKDFS